MLKRIVFGMMPTLLLIVMLTLAFNIQPVESDWTWTETIYIRADGSIEPPDAPILSADNITYTLTDNIIGNVPAESSAVVVERDNIVVDGASYTVQGIGASDSIGIILSVRSKNVKIKNTTIKSFNYGIYLLDSSNNSIVGNNITANNYFGIYILWSANNSISGNNIANNDYGVYVEESSDNMFYHNNLIDNTQQVCIYPGGYANAWDGGYPSGGNYWSDYEERYPSASGIDDSGIWDTPYVLDENNQDNYPLMKPFPWAQHDLGITNLALSKTAVGQGFDLDINITVFNYGISTETFNITAYANTTIIAALTNITLPSGSSTTVTFTWNTTSFDKGNYTISAYAWPVPGETDTADNVLVDGWVFLTLLGDVNGDKIVDVTDISMTIDAYGKTDKSPGWYAPTWISNMDVNCDNIIDITDISMVIDEYGNSW